MSQMVETNAKTFQASAALSQWRRVRLNGSNKLAYAGADDADWLGILKVEVVAADAYAAVQLRTATGTVKMVASGAISQEAAVYAAADGKIASSGTQFIGEALEAAAADGDIIEVLPFALTTAELSYLDGITAGTVAASKACVVDSNKDLGDFRNLDCQNLDAGASGTAGTVDIFPTTASKGKFVLSCADQTGDTTFTLEPAAHGQQTKLVVPDGGQATAYAVQSTAALTLAEADVLDGATAGTGVASKAMVLDSNSEFNSIGVIKSVDLLLSTAQVKALNGTPITVLAAVGAGVYAEFLGAYVFIDYVSAAYASDAGEDLVFQNLSGGAEVSQSIDGTVFHATADALIWVGPKGDEANTTNTMVANGGFEVTVKTGEWITGDSPIKIRLYYREIRKTALEAIS